MFPSVHDDRARVSFIDKQAFRYTNNTVSDYFHLKTDLLFKESKRGKALASLVAPSPTPLVFTCARILFLVSLLFAVTCDRSLLPF